MARHLKGTTPTLTEELIDQLAAAIRHGAYVETAVALCGIPKQNFYRWLNQAESEEATPLTVKLSDAVKKGMAEAEMRDLAVIDAAAQRGEWTAAAWRLERKFPQKWGRQARIQLEHSGPDGSKIPIDHTIDLTKLSKDELLLLEKVITQDAEDIHKSQN